MTDIGLQLLASFLISDLKIGLTLAILQKSGKTSPINDEFKIIVRGFDTRSPLSLMIVVGTLSGPAVFPFFNFLIAMPYKFHLQI